MSRISSSVLFLLLSTAISSQARALELGCGESPKEPSLIKARAAGVVTRKGKHEIKVITGTGMLSFKDKPPYNAPMDGVRYTFCDRKDGFILVHMMDGDSFTGKLINEQTGIVTDAGHDVVISNDSRAYLAESQSNGMDGSEWKIHAINGKVSWSGFSFLKAKSSPDEVYADLSAPTWLPNGELSATAACTSDSARTWQVKLVKGTAAWSWKPQKACPAS